MARSKRRRVRASCGYLSVSDSMCRPSARRFKRACAFFSARESADVWRCAHFGGPEAVADVEARQEAAEEREEARLEERAQAPRGAPAPRRVQSVRALDLRAKNTIGSRSNSLSLSAPKRETRCA